MGTVTTEDVSTTHPFTVRNPHSKGIVISNICQSGENAGYFRLNVDGFTGHEFCDVEIRANDSISMSSFRVTSRSTTQTCRST